MSDDGQRVLFIADKNNAGGHGTPEMHAFVSDLGTGDLTEVSTPDGATGFQTLAAISGDGQHAAILVVVPGVAQRLWVVDIATGDATLATTSDYGVESNNFGIDWLRISTDGTKVAFESEATNLDPADRDSVSDIYVKDITTGDLQLASVTAAGVKGNNNGAGSNYGAVQPDISGDGTHVSFLSNASNLGGSVSSSSDFNLYVKELKTFLGPSGRQPGSHYLDRRPGRRRHLSPEHVRAGGVQL